MVDLQSYLNKQKEQTNGEQKVKFNFKKGNSLANNAASVLQNSDDPAPKAVGPAKFSFTKSASSPPATSENATTNIVGSEDGGGEAVIPSVTAPVSLEDIAEQVVDDFSFEGQPEKYTEEAAQKIKGALDLLANSIDDKNMVGQGVTLIMKTLADYPFLKDNLRPEDFQLMTRGLRESYGVVVAKKSAGKAKRAAKEKAVDETVGFLKDLGIGDDLGSLV